MANFTLQQLEVFFAIVEYHSLSNAARVLFISQPSLSKTLSRLEENLGVILFDRSSGILTLTEAGNFLYSRLKAGYKTMLQAVEEARYSQSHHNRTLNIGLHTSFERSREFQDVWDILEAYENANPDVCVNEELFEYSELRTALLSGKVDVILTHSIALRDIPELEIQKLRKLRFYVAMSASHPLASSETLDLERLNDAHFLFVSGTNTKRDIDFCIERLRNAGIQSQNISFLQNAHSMAKAVVRNKGMMLTCHSHGFSEKELKLFPVKDTPVPVFLDCAWRANDRKRELHDFLHLLSAQIASPGE